MRRRHFGPPDTTGWRPGPELESRSVTADRAHVDEGVWLRFLSETPAGARFASSAELLHLVSGAFTQVMEQWVRSRR
jgi:hypothetical protein